MAAPHDGLCYRGRPLTEWLADTQAGEDVWQEVGEAVKAVVQRLGESARRGDEAERLRAVRALRQLGEQLQWSVPLLQKSLKQVALDDADGPTRAEAAEALSQHVGPHAGLQVGALAEALRDELPAVRLGATRALAELGPRGFPAIPGLIHAAHWDHDAAVRTHAAVAIWKIDRRDRIAVPVLTRALREPDECLRWVAADCLGDIGADAADAADALRAALEDTYRTPLVRQALRLALERIECAAQAVSA
jgi:HEAT repeat protein